MDIPKEVTKTLYVTYGIGQYNQGDINILDYLRLREDDPGWTRILLCELPFTVEIPDIDFKEASKTLIAALEKKKENIHAEYHLKLTEVDNRIKDLLALPSL